MNLEEIIKEGLGTIVDVRTYGEFSGGHVVGSINIPLNEVPERIEELQQMKAPLILCCASGMRSGQAQEFLSQQGIECYNALDQKCMNFLHKYKKLEQEFDLSNRDLDFRYNDFCTLNPYDLFLEKDKKNHYQF